MPFIDKKFNARDYFKNTIGVISPQGPPPEIKIAVKKRQAQYLITQTLRESQDIVEEKDDEIIFRLKVHPTYELIIVLMGYGAELKVLEPENLKQEFVEAIRAMLGQYK